jgi:MFS transporter, PAT family, beta-lactamase induction signal transducer AmpG
MSQKGNNRSPWAWIPTLYLYQGIPYTIVMTTSGLIYKTMGVSVASFAFWTSLLYLPWTFKFIWSPYVDVVSTKRNWTIWTQLLMGLAFIGLGLVIPLGAFYPISLLILFAIAFLSASHDIAADGFYMYALNQHQQAFFVGIRSTFYRFAMLAALGLIPVIAGVVQKNTGLKPVEFEANSVSYHDYEPFDPGTISISATDVKPVIRIFPSVINVPLYKQGESEADSTVVYIALSAPPPDGETVVVNVARKTGTKDIDIPKGRADRFEFTDANWNKPEAIIIKVNRNLTETTTSGFLITAGNIAFSWVAALGLLGVFLLLLAVYNKFIMPHPAENNEGKSEGLKAFIEVWNSFFSKPGVIPAVLFFLLYRLGESQLVKIATPFLVDSRSSGGLGLTSAEYGIVYGTIGIIALTIGGILGGVMAARYGLKKLIWPMALALNVPSAVYIWLAYVQPMPGDISIYLSVGIEQLGYGFGFTGYMLYMLHYVGDSKYKTAEYAIGTSLMAFGMMLPGMISGKISELLGYEHFFIYVMICTIPGMAMIYWLRIDPQFGLKKKE